MTKQYLESLLTGAKGNKNVKVINNTTVNGDDYHIKPYETLVIVNNTATYTQDLFLPYIGESVGMMLVIKVPDFGGGGTIYDNNDSDSDWTDLTMNADNEYAVLFNNGRSWCTILSDM